MPHPCCLGGLVGAAAAAFTALALPAGALAAEPLAVLFVGNSYTFGRVAPVLNYNAAAVHDLTAAFNAISPVGTSSYPVGTAGKPSYEPHPWGGVPGIFKKFTDEAGLNVEVALSTRNAATLRGHFLNTANPAWDLRGNVASRAWDAVVLQAQSDEPLPPGRGKNANPAGFAAYARQFERYIHDGAAQSYTETQLFGSLAACEATRLAAATCGLLRQIPANPNARAATRIFLEQTWARPDMVQAHLVTTPDLNSPSGAPVVDTSTDPNGVAAKLYYSDLTGMTADLHAAFYGLAASSPGFAGVVPVGDAFQRAVNQGLAPGSGFYAADGTYAEPGGGTIDLWWLDRTHPSKYGAYLSALTLFGSLTGIDPWSLGASEQAAAELGIAPADALKLQRVASEQLYAAGLALRRIPCLHAHPHAGQAGACR
ncbi:MAG: hypothetical protein KGL18_11280 [Burkholderiales bacterium]|nr:hypothetical protein [Burkholderiales bacterium]MDE1928192.1 hypothetical protein [Burkholderiales bacterium]MDE2160401.1 hypothetical protein [Burkholderiales bacterium]MDE2503537.1 hypothetical protein [Burkholderiales bacterium]